MIHFFCPSCWREISEQIICPFCQYDLREFHKLSYEDKLIGALKHPIKEIRKTAVFIIGLKRIEKAVTELERMINEEEDPFILMEIVKALRQIKNREAKVILEKLSSHRSSLIANFVKQSDLYTEPLNSGHRS